MDEEHMCRIMFNSFLKKNSTMRIISSIWKNKSKFVKRSFKPTNSSHSRKHLPAQILTINNFDQK